MKDKPKKKKKKNKRTKNTKRFSKTAKSRGVLNLVLYQLSFGLLKGHLALTNQNKHAVFSTNQQQGWHAARFPRLVAAACSVSSFVLFMIGQMCCL